MILLADQALPFQYAKTDLSNTIIALVYCTYVMKELSVKSTANGVNNQKYEEFTHNSSTRAHPGFGSLRVCVMV